ncbi:MAG: YdbH domain-containing protein, partial [Erythrobacter sp.]
AEYSAGDNAIALPNFSVRQEPGGSFLFSGALTASGALPGGSVSGLFMPINGRFDQTGGLVMGTRCETVRFRSLALYDLALGAQSIRLCPSERRAMLRYDDALSIGVQTDDLALTGDLAETPSKISASRASLNYPGAFALENLTARIGEPGYSVLMSAASLTGNLDESIAGEFSDARAQMDAVPLDLSDLAGQWSYVDDVLRVEQAGFTLTERTDFRPRFEPLRSEGAALTLFDSVITANAILRHPASGTAITNVAMRHDLVTSTGYADIGVDALTFGSGGSGLSLDDLTYLSKGIIAYTEGSVSGEGRIDWTADDITSTGTFRSDGLDFAAAFGPIDRLRGEVRFSDLVNLTTEPGQVIEIGAINPGIEVLGGRVQFSMVNGEVIRIEDGRWPFMGGELIVRPATLRYGTAEEHRYTFEMIGLDAAEFVAQMELTNLGASGLFDGTVPIIFDAEGNGRIEDGLLISRAPGGNVSYIGELTYEDMGAITNYAFQSLRSLDYTQMSVGLNGDLAGEIITRFQFDGVQQGEGADRNFITRRLAKLPIRFNVNVRSENFYELATMVRTFWYPEALGGPEDKGLDLTGVLPARMMRTPAPSDTPLPPDPSPAINATANEPRRPDEPAVQPSESEPMR